MRTYDHRNRQDLLALSEDLETLSEIQKAATVLFAIRAGILSVSAPIRLSYGLVRLVFGSANGTARAAAGMTVHFPSAARELWSALIDHVTDGRNADDPTSAGGWNKRDLEVFLGIVGKLGWAPPRDRPGCRLE